MKIKGFSNYELLDGGCVLNLKTNKIVTETKSKCSNTCFLKMKDDNNKWISIAKRTIVTLANGINIPNGSVEIPNIDNYFINKNGEVISCTIFKQGEKLKIYYPKDMKKYPTVTLNGKKIAIHQLLAITFLDKDYVKKGLVVMHLDNNKNNHTLENIRLGTYSENNKQAYNDGLNHGNELKKKKT